jgi:hypothetical protein
MPDPDYQAADAAVMKALEEGLGAAGLTADAHGFLRPADPSATVTIRDLNEALARIREIADVRWTIVVPTDFPDEEFETARRLLAEAPWGERVEVRRSRLAGTPEPGSAFVLRLPEMLVLDPPYPIPRAPGDRGRRPAPAGVAVPDRHLMARYDLQLLQEPRVVGDHHRR